MRMSAFDDCIRVFGYYEIEPSSGAAIDVGGTDIVCLKTSRGLRAAANPLLRINSTLVFLDAGFNVETLSASADEVVDFLDWESIRHLQGKFDLTFCFDTLEHVSNPFRFCDHLIRITKPSGFVYVSTVFQYVYHPSPRDYFRFSPDGLRQCFVDASNHSHECATVAWCGWESDGDGVALLAYKGADRKFGQYRLAASRYTKEPFRTRVRRSVGQILRKARSRPDSSPEPGS